MPNPMFLQVMGVTIHEYNSYSPKKKAQFQQKAQAKLIDLHERDIKKYTSLTAATVKQQEETAEAEEADFRETEEGE